MVNAIWGGYMGELKAKKNRIFDRFQGKLDDLKDKKDGPSWHTSADSPDSPDSTETATLEARRSQGTVRMLSG